MFVILISFVCLIGQNIDTTLVFYPNYGAGAELTLETVCFSICNDNLKCLSLYFEDTLRIESDIPISDAAEIFINYMKEYYDFKMRSLYKEIELLRNK